MVSCGGGEGVRQARRNDDDVARVGRQHIVAGEQIERIVPSVEQFAQSGVAILAPCAPA